MKIYLPAIKRICHCNAVNIDYETYTTLENGYERLRRSDAPTPIRKILCKRLFTLLENKTTSLGATLLDVIRLGLFHHDSPVGAVFPDQYAYDTFYGLYNPLLEIRHFGFDLNLGDKHPPVSWGDWRRVENLDPENKRIQRVTVSASRNLDGFRFTPTISMEELHKVEDLIMLTLYRLPGEYKGEYYYIQCLTPKQKERMQSKNCMFDHGDTYHQAANTPRFWSYGRGVYVNSTRSFVVWVNAKDHMRVIAQEDGGNLQNAYRRIANVMPYLDCRLRPAHHERLGYLTLNVDDVGTGLCVAADVRLPGMPNAIMEKVAKVYHMEMRCLEGDLYQVSCRSRLGYTEYEVMKEFNHGLRELLYMANFIERFLPTFSDEDESEGSSVTEDFSRSETQDDGKSDKQDNGKGDMQDEGKKYHAKKHHDRGKGDMQDEGKKYEAKKHHDRDKGDKQDEDKKHRAKKHHDRGKSDTEDEEESDTQEDGKVYHAEKHHERGKRDIEDEDKSDSLDEDKKYRAKKHHDKKYHDKKHDDKTYDHKKYHDKKHDDKTYDHKKYDKKHHDNEHRDKKHRGEEHHDKKHHDEEHRDRKHHDKEHHGQKHQDKKHHDKKYDKLSSDESTSDERYGKSKKSAAKKLPKHQKDREKKDDKKHSPRKRRTHALKRAFIALGRRINM